MTAGDGNGEPTAAASPEEQRRFLALTGLLIAGPSIWMTHFFAVYLLAEAWCAVGVDAKVLSLPLLSAVTLLATALAVVAAAVTTLLAYRRWRRTASTSHAGDDQSSETEGGHDAQIALAGFLLGILFIVAVLFVGMPAVVLDPC
ncbi:MAG: hypothetical protein KY441_10110 [Actinobacteria bacterium]|nr:hypothetical protein [Actinomycetota bacterium]